MWSGGSSAEGTRMEAPKAATGVGSGEGPLLRKILAFSPSKWCILMHSGARFWLYWGVSTSVTPLWIRACWPLIIWEATTDERNLSEITTEPVNSTSSRTTVSKNLGEGGGWARFGGLCPPGPNVEPPLFLSVYWYFYCNFQRNITMICAKSDFSDIAVIANTSCMIQRRTQKIFFCDWVHLTRAGEVFTAPQPTNWSDGASSAPTAGSWTKPQPQTIFGHFIRILCDLLHICFSAFW